MLRGSLAVCALLCVALAELRRVEARLSLFDDASDLCELNRRAGVRLGYFDKLGHIMNPFSGAPVEVDQKVTVIAPTALAADALSTGVLVHQQVPDGVRAIFTPE